MSLITIYHQTSRTTTSSVDQASASTLASDGACSTADAIAGAGVHPGAAAASSASKPNEKDMPTMCGVGATQEIHFCHSKVARLLSMHKGVPNDVISCSGATYFLLRIFLSYSRCSLPAW